MHAEGFLGELAPERHQAVVEIALAEGRYEDALRAIRAADVGSCLACVAPLLARAYTLMGRPDSAIAAAERFLDTTFYDAGLAWTLYYPILYERLALLYDRKGDPENAARYHEQFVDAWVEADPDLQPRVSAARERLREIAAARK